LLVGLFFFWGHPLKAEAAPFFINSTPNLEKEQGEIVLLVGGISEDGSTIKPSSIEVEIDGAKGPELTFSESFSEIAQTATEQSSSWKSPLAVGVVYLWVKDVPASVSEGILQGLEGFFRRIPSRSNAYTTLYGRKRQPIPKLQASEIAGHLHDLGYLDGNRPNLAEAILVNLKALSTDEGALKVLLVITDGRDFADPLGESSADFSRIAYEVHKAGVKLLVINFPAPAADAEQSRKNMADLSSLGTFWRVVEQPIEVQTTLEALGQSIADLRLVQMPLPWKWKTFGGAHHTRLKLKVDSKYRPLELGKIIINSEFPWPRILGIILVVVCVGIVILILVWNRSRSTKTHEDNPTQNLLEATYSLVHRGLPASRILVELTREFPRDVFKLATLDPTRINDSRNSLFNTRAERRRFEEVVEALTNQKTLLGSDLAAILAHAIENGLPSDQTAIGISAKVPEDQRGHFSRMGLEDLARALQEASAKYPVLASLRARGIALEIQELLRSECKSSRSTSIAWLVRVSGPGKRGETLQIQSSKTILGKNPTSNLCIPEDTMLSDQHAEIRQKRGAYSILPLQGSVFFGEQPVLTLHPLGDGDIFRVGQSRVVFKCNYTGRISRSQTGA
jgi:hypothetical protein